MTGSGVVPRTSPAGVYAAGEVTLLDLLDRLLEGGIAVQGEVTLAAADIDLVNVSLRLLVGATDTVRREAGNPRNSGLG